MTLNEALMKMGQQAEKIERISPESARAVRAWAEHTMLALAVETATTSGNPIGHEQAVGKIMILEELCALMEQNLQAKAAQEGKES